MEYSGNQYSASRPNSGGSEFERFRNFLHSHSGIALTESKQYLINSRLKPILSHYGIESVEKLMDSVESLNEFQNRHLVEEIIDAMTTNETFWFRDNFFFDYLKNHLLPDRIGDESKHHPLRIWSAACSSGQEPYSVSILVEEVILALKAMLKTGWREVEIISTDISKEMIARAKAAVYSGPEVARGLNDDYIRKYFTRVDDNEIQVKSQVKSRIQFRVHNLLESFTSLGQFDVVLCRNVLIYFDPETVNQILLKIHSCMRKDAVLFLSASEVLHDMDDFFEPVSIDQGFMYKVIK